MPNPNSCVNDCPGPNRCHGCMRWCDVCGDVDATCDSVQGSCDQHHCQSCKQLLGHDDRCQDDWRSTCATCLHVALNDDQIVRFERALARGDDDACMAIARDLDANPAPYLGTMASSWWGAHT